MTRVDHADIRGLDTACLAIVVELPLAKAGSSAEARSHNRPEDSPYPGRALCCDKLKICPFTPLLKPGVCRNRKSPGDPPHKRRQLPGNRRHRNLALLPPDDQPPVTGTKSNLGFPGDRPNTLGQAFLTIPQPATDPRPKPVRSGRLHKHWPGMAVAGPGDATAFRALATEVFRENRAKVCHALPGMIETVQVCRFGKRSGGNDQENTAQPLKGCHYRPRPPFSTQLANLPGQRSTRSRQERTASTYSCKVICRALWGMLISEIRRQRALLQAVLPS